MESTTENRMGRLFHGIRLAKGGSNRAERNAHPPQIQKKKLYEN